MKTPQLSAYSKINDSYSPRIGNKIGMHIFTTTFQHYTELLATYWTPPHKTEYIQTGKEDGRCKTIQK